MVIMITPGLSDAVWQTAQANRVKCPQQNVSAWLGSLKRLKANALLLSITWWNMNVNVIWWDNLVMCKEHWEQTFGFSSFQLFWWITSDTFNFPVNDCLKEGDHIIAAYKLSRHTKYSVPAWYRSCNMFYMIDFGSQIIPNAIISHVDCP